MIAIYKMQVLDIMQCCDDIFGKCTVFNHMNDPLAPQANNKQLGFRCTVSGSSGSGKTNAVLSLIFNNQIKWDHIYLYTTTPEQRMIQLLFQVVNKHQQDYKEQFGKDINMITVGTSTDEIIPLEDIPNNRKNLVIIDDMLQEKDQSLIETYFVKSRHKCCSVFYLGQNFTAIPKTVRKNSDYFMIFKPATARDLQEMVSQLNLLCIDRLLFKKMIVSATDDHNFMVVDRRTNVDLLKVRKNWENVWNSQTEKFEKIDLLQLRRQFVENDEDDNSSENSSE